MAELLKVCRDYPPANYERPPFPYLDWPPLQQSHNIFFLYDSWKFTLLWTLIIYASFHMTAAAIAVMMQTRRKRSLQFVWAIPLAYALVAGIEGLVAGSVVGLVLGAVYIAGCYQMSTWIPFVWGWINVLVLIISSFTIQGGL